MRKPWFGRKKIGWGWGLPQNWQDWLVLLTYMGFNFILSYLTQNHQIFLTLLILSTIIFISIVWKTSGRPQWGTWWNKS